MPGFLLPPVLAGEKFNMLMGKGEAAQRRTWLQLHGNEAEADV
jgi:topoisomerase-4 subunit B